MDTSSQHLDDTGRDNGGLIAALSAPQPSVRLHAAMAAGTRPCPGIVPLLVERCGVEPDFFVRDMLTWALTRQAADQVVPHLLSELRSPNPRARSQSLHTLSKIGDRGSWAGISTSVVHDADEDVARSAWRAAVALVPDDGRAGLAAQLAEELGRGGPEVRLSLSRALIALGDSSAPAMRRALTSDDPEIQAHARATELLRADPDREFSWALQEARRVTIVGTEGESDADR
ncbi:HEAT repeat domain-containing protein [Brooklawnia cerclae]|uniref:HEAT repeat protein n=1 Tax=Brooklawnia cerclae TaxID=349934 RepID=A0ABX0SHG2_9ACTN|nr:HEAT repeat domain-containing protein [Brooklawnia cerclae]NIH57843.1 HEAT repeat protein [Brooklawnia cerclae]